MLRRFLQRTIVAALACAASSAAYVAIAAEADRIAAAKLDSQILGNQPLGQALPATDEVFARRAYLDLVGMIPVAEELEAFCTSSDPAKRELLVEQLLDDPRYILHWASVLDGWLMERRPTKHVPVDEWNAYLRAAVATDKPWNELAREILSAESTDAALRPAAKFMLDRDADAHLLTRDIGRIFFGVDLQCAQCHDHPLIDDYLQADYHGLYAFVQRTQLFNNEENKQMQLAEMAEGEADFKSVFTGDSGRMGPRFPDTAEVPEPMLPVGEHYIVPPAPKSRTVPKYSRRAKLGELAGSGTSRQFSANVVNRIWNQLVGHGFVSPVDLHHAGNPPSHPEAFQLLIDEFATGGFRLRPLIRKILLTNTYARPYDLPSDAIVRQQLNQELSQFVTAVADREPSAATERQAAEQFSGLSTEVHQQRKLLAPLHEAEQAKIALALAAQKARDGHRAIVGPISDRIAAKEVEADAAVMAAGAALSARVNAPSDAALADVSGQARIAADQRLAELAAWSTELSAHQPQSELVELNLRNALGEVDVARLALQTARVQFKELETRWLSARQVWREAARHKVQTERKVTAGQMAEQALSAMNHREPYVAIVAASTEVDMAVDATRPSNITDLASMADLEWDLVNGDLAERWSRHLLLRPLRALTPEQFGWSMLTATRVIDTHRTQAEAEVESQIPVASTDGNLVLAAERRLKIAYGVHAKLKDSIQGVVSLYSAPSGQTQDAFFATPDQALLILNSWTLNAWSSPGGGNLVEKLVSIPDATELANRLYLSTLGRRPTLAEVEWVQAALAAQPDARHTLVRDMTWALVASSEFRFEH